MYPFTSVYKHELTIYTFHQNDLTIDQRYKKFNTRSDVANAIGVTIQQKVLLENVAQKKYSDFFKTPQGKMKSKSGCRGMISQLRFITT